jgi:hypothetical protein
VPQSKTENKRLPVDSKAISKAIDVVSALSGTKKKSIREACKMYKAPLVTLSRHLKALKHLGDKHFSYCVMRDVNMVFTDLEEQSLVQYIQTVAKMQNGSWHRA